MQHNKVEMTEDSYMENMLLFGNIDGVDRLPMPTSQTHNRNLSSDSMSSALSQSPMSNAHLQSLEDFRRRRPSPPSASRSAGYGSSSYPRTRRVQIEAASDEDDEMLDNDPLPADATEEEKARHKRRKNTLAARRSRRRRLQQFEQLEEANRELNRDRDMWRERALTLERILANNNLPYPNFNR